MLTTLILSTILLKFFLVLLMDITLIIKAAQQPVMPLYCEKNASYAFPLLTLNKHHRYLRTLTSYQLPYVFSHAFQLNL